MGKQTEQELDYVADAICRKDNQFDEIRWLLVQLSPDIFHAAYDNWLQYMDKEVPDASV